MYFFCWKRLFESNEMRESTAPIRRTGLDGLKSLEFIHSHPPDLAGVYTALAGFLSRFQGSEARKTLACHSEDSRQSPWQANLPQ